MGQFVHIFLLLILQLALGGTSVLTPPTTGCKELLTYSYAYNNFYHVDESRQDGEDGNVSINMYVQAVSDAHVLLSSAPFPRRLDPVYEVVLGGGHNTFSEIRRLQRTSTQIALATADLLSATELRGFWVRFDSTGMLQVGKQGNDLPMLFWRDTQPLKIRYFSFSTWTGVAGKFIFDCPSAEKSDGTESSEAVQRQMTTLETLRSDLLTHYDPYSRPVLHEDHYTTVYLRFYSDHIQLEEKRSLLTINGKMSMKWIDEKLVWDPESYDNISFLNLASHEAWLPEIVLYNAAGHGANILDNAGLVVSSEGRAWWEPQAHLKSWCSLDLRRWPRDEHVCNLRFGFWTQQQPRLLLDLDYETQVSEQRTGSQWEVVGLNSQIVWDAEVWANGASEYEKQLNEVPTSNLVVQIRLRRHYQSYGVVLTAPFIVINAIVLLSFWISPNNFTKTLLVCLALVISSMVAAVLIDVVPVHPSHTPSIVVAYSRSMIGALITLLLSVVTICLSRYEHIQPLPNFLYMHITSENVSTVLRLPRAKNKVASHYSQLEETPESNALTKIPHQEIQHQWIILAIYIDRTCSILYCIFIGIVLATC